MIGHIILAAAVSLAAFLLINYGASKKDAKGDAVSRHPAVFSEHDLKSISILKKTYGFDFENDRAEIPLVFENAEEIIDASLSDERTVTVSDSFVEYMMKKISLLPKRFRADVSLAFRDTGGRSGEELLDAVQEKLEASCDRIAVLNKKSFFRASLYIVLCILLSLIGRVPLNVGSYAGAASSFSLIIGILLENAALLILWQAGYTIFDIVDREGVSNSALYRRINRIRLTDGQGRTIAREGREIFRYSANYKPKERAAHLLLLFANGYVLSICVIEVLSYITSRVTIGSFDLIVLFAQWLCILITTYADIAFYFDRGRIVRYAFGISLGYSILLAVYNLSRLIYIAVNAIPFDSEDFLFVYLILSLVNTMCIYLIRRERKKRVEHLASLLLP